MNEQFIREQIKKFLADPGMSMAVRHFIERSFLKKRNHNDIYFAAAERIAIDLLVEAFKEMETEKNMNMESREKNLSHV